MLIFVNLACKLDELLVSWHKGKLHSTQTSLSWKSWFADFQTSTVWGLRSFQTESKSRLWTLLVKTFLVLEFYPRDTEDVYGTLSIGEQRRMFCAACCFEGSTVCTFDFSVYLDELFFVQHFFVMILRCNGWTAQNWLQERILSFTKYLLQ